MWVEYRINIWKNIMKVMIFVVGLGSWFKFIIDICFKVLVMVGGKIMLEYIILKLKVVGFDEIVINVYYFFN